MLEMLRSLFRHMAWADSQILAAGGAHPEAAADVELSRALHHIVRVQRYFLSRFLGRPFDLDAEMRPCDSFEELERRFRETHAEELAFVDRIGPEALAPILEFPPRTDIRPTVGEAMVQVAMHSQHHRGQCATRLRVLGVTPPTVDFILWLKDRP